MTISTTAIAGTPEELTEVEEEYARAKAEGRQPNCPYCGEPLIVKQTQYQFIQWTWDAKQFCYVKDDSQGDSEEPFCSNCERKDWDFIDQDSNNPTISF